MRGRLSELIASLSRQAASDPADLTSEMWVREFARQMRARLRKVSGAPSWADKVARQKSREAMKGKRRERPRQLEKQVLVARYGPSPIMDALMPRRSARWIDIMRRQKKRDVETVSLEKFSFLDNADETLKALKKIAEIEGRELYAILNFEDDYCLDAGAFLVLADIWPRMAPIFAGGKMGRPIQKVLSATGVSRNNNMSMVALGNERAADGTLLAHSDVWAFPLQRRRPALSSRSLTVHLDPQAREMAAGRFCDAVNDWLGIPEIDQELTVNGRAWLASIIGELLCNAERHSQPASDDGDWSTTAFMVRREENGIASLKCYIAFLSVGRSFAESMSDAAADVSQQLKEYQAKHKKCGVSQDTLATVFALQDTITCDPSASENRSGGTGLQDVLEFVDLLGGTTCGDACVTIVSGRSCIQLTAPYIPGKRRDDLQPRLQWCNEGNTSEIPPDRNVVYDLTEHFAGALVSVAFTLDPDYLAASVESGDDAND